MKLTPIEEEQLENNLLQNVKNHLTGKMFNMDPTYLQTFSYYLKSFLSQLEIACLNEFEFQNLLIELAINNPKKINELVSLKDYILNEIRIKEIFWIQGSQIYQELTHQEQQIDQKHLKTFNTYREQAAQFQKIFNQFQFKYQEKQFQNEQQTNGIKMFKTNIQNEDYENHIKRCTRGQKYKSIDQEPQIEQNFYEFQQNCFFPIKKKFVKIEHQIIPLIYKFVTQKKQVNQEKQFKLQNFLLFLLTDHNNEIKYRHDQFFLKTTINENNQYHTDKNNQDIQNHYNHFPLLKSFDEFCDQKNIMLNKIIPNQVDTLKKRLNLISNTLSLSFTYLYIKPENIQEIKNDSLPFLLAQPENCHSVSTQILVESVGFYIKMIENKNFNKESYFIYQKLNENKENLNKISENDLTFIKRVAQQYNQILSAPEMKQKRQYQFHSNDRIEWNDQQYHKFLKGLMQYYSIPINNKLISKYIGLNIQSNHVRYIKGRYLRSIKDRSKQDNIPLKDILQHDIDNFCVDKVKL